MIAKISRGHDIGGLLRYLLGPGRFNDHVDPHVMGSWDSHPQSHQPGPATGPSGVPDVSVLTQDLTAAAVAAGVPLSASAAAAAAAGTGRPPVRGPVWHCSLRNHATDRALTDAEWERVVVDLLHRTGIAPRGDAGACRWVAVRHGPDHVHVAAMLVRQDNGRRVHPRNDYKMARETCRAAERRFGLTSTAPADRTVGAPSTRAEMEKAARRGLGEPSRVWLRRAARIAAVQAQDPVSFFARLGDLGVLVRPRRDAAGQVVGYSVAAPGDVTVDGAAVWFAGGKLANDLTLGRLTARWASAPPPAPPVAPAAGEHAPVGRVERAEAVAEATSAVEHAAVEVATGAGDGDGDGEVAGVIHAAGDMFTAVGATIERTPDALSRAAELYDRAARSSGRGQPTRWGPIAAQLRTAAWRLSRVRGLRARDNGVPQLVLACAALMAEIAAYYEQRRAMAQAQAAARSARIVREHRPVPVRGPGGPGTGARRDPRGPGRVVAAPPRPATGPRPAPTTDPGPDPTRRNR